jgi:subtilisin family serine protease
MLMSRVLMSRMLISAGLISRGLASRALGSPARLLARAGVALGLGLLPALPLLTATAAPAVAAPADTVRDSEQWVLDMLRVQAAWQTTRGAGVIVAVIDSGVSQDATDLAGSVISGPDFTGLTTKPSSQLWGQHGTWMASIIAGHGHDGGYDGIVGVAPEAKILSIRVIPDMNDPGYKHYNGEPEEVIQDELAKGIMTAVRDHARVLSMSIGYSAPSGVVRKALQYAYKHGTVLVASSGNSGDNDTRHGHGWAPVSFPAEYPGVISVGAVTMYGTTTKFSSGNLSVKIAAPGKGVPAQGRNDVYYTVDGTSPACALVAGVAALIESKYPAITPAQVTEALISTAQQTSARQGAAGDYNVLTGFGIVRADAALTAAGKLVRQRPQASRVPNAAHFGGGAAAVPPPPVAPRGNGQLVLFAVLTVMSSGAAYAGYRVIRRKDDDAGPPGPHSLPVTPVHDPPEAAG